MRRSQQRILAAMFEEARRRTAEGLSLPEVVKAVGLVWDDLQSAHCQGITLSLTSEHSDLHRDCDDTAETSLA